MGHIIGKVYDLTQKNFQKVIEELDKANDYIKELELDNARLNQLLADEQEYTQKIRELKYHNDSN